MAINTLALATIMTQELDKQLVAGATSSWMQQNQDKLIFTGYNTCKVPKISMSGLGNYSRTSANAFPTGGAVNLQYETFTMGQDRAQSFVIDAQDVDESNFIATAANIMGEFQRTQVIPELDAYRYSKLASTLITAGQTNATAYAPSKADILTTLKGDIEAIKDKVGDIPLVVTMSRATQNILENSSEIVRQLQVGDFQGNGDLVVKCKFVDETPIISVPSARFKSAYTFNDGSTTGQTVGGFTSSTSGKSINWIIMPQTSPIAVVKANVARIFTPDVLQTSIGYKIDYRVYHDLFLEDNQLPACYVNMSAN